MRVFGHRRGAPGNFKARRPLFDGLVLGTLGSLPNLPQRLRVSRRFARKKWMWVCETARYRIK
jgi:hypothetical protein